MRMWLFYLSMIGFPTSSQPRAGFLPRVKDLGSDQEVAMKHAGSRCASHGDHIEVTMESQTASCRSDGEVVVN